MIQNKKPQTLQSCMYVQLTNTIYGLYTMTYRHCGKTYKPLTVGPAKLFFNWLTGWPLDLFHAAELDGSNSEASHTLSWLARGSHRMQRLLEKHSTWQPLV